MQPAEVRAFKTDLASYYLKLEQIKRYDELIERLYDILGGVRAIDPSKEPIHSVPDKEKEYAIREQISRFEAKKQLLQAQTKDLEQTLERIEKPLCEAIIEVYAKHKTISSVARKMFFSESGLRKRMNKAIQKALID